MSRCSVHDAIAILAAVLKAAAERYDFTRTRFDVLTPDGEPWVSVKVPQALELARQALEPEGSTDDQCDQM